MILHLSWGLLLPALLPVAAMLLVLVHAFWREAGPPVALADVPTLAAPALAAALAWVAGPAILAPVTVPAVALLSAATAAWLCLRRTPAGTVPLTVSEASS